VGARWSEVRQDEREGPLIPLRGWAAAAGLASVVVVGSALSFMQSQQAERRAESVATTFVNLSHIDAVVPLVIAAEDAERALITTGDPAYRAAADGARGRLQSNVDAIAARVAPSQRADVEALRAKIAARQAAVDLTVKAWTTEGPEAALRLMRQGHGRGAMAALNEQLDRLRAAEQGRLVERTAVAQRAATIAAWAPVATAVAALLMLALCLRTLRQAARDRAAALATSDAAMRELSFVADAAPVYLAHLDAHERILFTNATFSQRFGRTPEEFVGRHAADILGPEAYAAMAPHIRRALAGEIVEVVLTAPLLGHGSRDLMCLCVPDRAADGSVVGFVAAVTDITRARTIERKLAEAHATLALALRAARAGGWSWDIASGRIEWSSEQHLLQGIAPERVPRDYAAWLALVHPDDRAGFEAEIAAKLAGTDAEFHYELRVLDTGHERWIASFGRIERDENGAAVRASGLTLDVTAQRQALAALTASERRFTVLAEFVPVIVWSMRPDGTSEWVNRAWHDYTGLGHEQGLDDMWARLLHPDDVQRAKDAWAQAAAGPAPMEMQYRLRRADGAYRWFVGRIAPQFDAHGRVTQWFGTAADIQDAKETERLLREQQRLLRDADRRKDEFIATLAHELRNPLAPIRSAATVLRQPEADATSRDRAASVIQRQVGTMALLLDDLLDVSRITRGTLKLHRLRVPLAEVIDSAVEIARPPMEARGHRLSIERPAPDVELDVDALRLSQVIANLLTNAAKYTDPGGAVRLGAVVDGDELRVAVRDTGIGLAPESQREIFRMFSQVRSSLDRSEGGLGIGLALVKGLVELHGGTIEAHSEGLGRGSEFRVTLPRVVTRELPRDALPDVRRERSSVPRRVLVADDSRDGAETLAMLLRLEGHEVRVAHDGLEALQLLREYKPDVALLDIGMPSMNGYEIVGAVRGEPWRRRATLVAITGWGQDEDKRRAKAAGFDVHLTKPVEPELLEEVLLRPRDAEAPAQRVN
jgi:PAS domain S-box-containing protein